MVGLDGDFKQIKDQLTGWSSRLEIISIVGMRGIGLLFSRNSQGPYQIQRHVNSELFDQRSFEKLEENVYKILKGRRYLIVMDDVWDTKAWDDVKRLFPYDKNGSRIIFTTRISEVALYANSDHDSIHHLNLLSREESWNLLRAKVYGEEICFPSEFDEIGKKISWSCKCLPLAIVVIGGLLSRGSRTRDYWEYFARNVLSAITGNGDQLTEIPSLSYNNLPLRLKACFHCW